jgi:tripartite-type tricarboxylate transporter receptor subunit TctC
MIMELFKAMAGIDLAQIPYRGTAPAVLATLSGEVSVIIADDIRASAHQKLRALAPALAAFAARSMSSWRRSADGVAWFSPFTNLFMRPCSFA